VAAIGEQGRPEMLSDPPLALDRLSVTMPWLREVRSVPREPRWASVIRCSGSEETKAVSPFDLASYLSDIEGDAAAGYLMEWASTPAVRYSESGPR